jgi:hypothetical protein
MKWLESSFAENVRLQKDTYFSAQNVVIKCLLWRNIKDGYATNAKDT